MGKVVGFECVRCGRQYDLDIGWKAFEGCPVCAREGQPANLSTVYSFERFDAARFARGLASRPRTMWRYVEFLPAASIEDAVSLHEGCTPLIRLDEFERDCGGARLYVKDESRNPTGSFKDRLASAAVSRAVELGATATTVSSTGNHGSSTVAYSSKAGLPSFVFTLDSVPLTMKVLMQVYGGRLVACRESSQRWALVAWGVRERGWYPVGNWNDPPIGSNPFGVDGYKTIALEICEEFGWKAPDAVVVPTAYGDGLYGIWKGFAEARRLGIVESTPRMYAAEVHGSLAGALATPGRSIESAPPRPSAAFSINTPRSTHQALRAILESDGGAVTVTDEEMAAVQDRLGRRGVYAELSSCISVAGAARLAEEGVIGHSDTVVAVLTATGQRDPWSTQSRMPAVPVVGPDPAELREALEKAYGVRI